MHVHFVAVAGTGMGSLAGLFKAAGHDVSGSDTAFYPPMGPALERWGIRVTNGFSAENLDPRPDLVVIGNVCRSDHPEARAAIDQGMNVTTMAHALRDHLLAQTSPLVVAGTHGKTTTSSLCAWIFETAERRPGFLIGGVPHNFDRGFQLPNNGRTERTLPLSTSRGRRVPFVVEGDEYDTAFFEKTPKFWHYEPEVAIITSIEHDHIDIYPDEASYLKAFVGFVERIPQNGLLVAHAGDQKVVEVVQAHAMVPVVWYGVEGDPRFGPEPEWLAVPGRCDASGQSFDLFLAGSPGGRAATRLSGRHGLQNSVAALAATCQGFGVPLKTAIKGLFGFEGVARRQEMIAEVAGVRVYDDFAHHPTAVRHTLAGLRARHNKGTLWAVYEPRTATACRKQHQQDYLSAFDAADEIVLAPLGRSAIAKSERLDLDALVQGLIKRGRRAQKTDSVDEIVDRLCEQTRAGDTIAILSNGAFGGIHQRLVDRLRDRHKKGPA